ncbi:ATPase involved in chromosome partitioning domain protein [Mycobacterium kansasii]|uniref:ATPase involved in chromosome partitioning domain protein n=1 Tax=Mycobacterium kansasii TaxID=1768 RepID=A0A1V3WAV4_MYCKA|nr:ATPase involved in chromosome partitioning domain protein [Mycobacterium kansasii]
MRSAAPDQESPAAAVRSGRLRCRCRGGRSYPVAADGDGRQGGHRRKV